jgi:carbamate kinase
VVPSPEPLGILELAAVRSLVDAGVLVIASGGGGVPVVLTANGYRGVEAVVDKDLAAERLADELGADALALVTGVPAAAIDFGSASERPLRDVTVVEAERHLQDGQFPAGSMGPRWRRPPASSATGAAWPSSPARSSCWRRSRRLPGRRR